jgi:hypothetical protein
MKIKLIIIVLVCILFSGCTTTMFQNEHSEIQNELENHLVSNNENIIIKNIKVLTKELDDTWRVQLGCYNKAQEIYFAEVIFFDSVTKEITGYDVVEYKE